MLAMMFLRQEFLNPSRVTKPPSCLRSRKQEFCPQLELLSQSPPSSNGSSASLSAVYAPAWAGRN